MTRKLKDVKILAGQQEMLTLKDVSTETTYASKRQWKHMLKPDLLSKNARQSLIQKEN